MNRLKGFLTISILALFFSSSCSTMRKIKNTLGGSSSDSEEISEISEDEENLMVELDNGINENNESNESNESEEALKSEVAASEIAELDSTETDAQDAQDIANLSSVEEEEKMAKAQLQDEGKAQTEMGTYQIKKGDTWMLLAFKFYGDYRKWRELMALNRDTLGAEGMAVGQSIRHPLNKASKWESKGNPYIIIRGDTLGKISMKKYGTSKKWKEIWHNNKRLILNPDLIFAGFTLYYIPKGEFALR